MSTQTELTLNVYGRDQKGKSAAYQARKAGKVPGVVYGPQFKGSINVCVLPNEFKKLYKQAGRTSLITLKSVEGAAKDLDGAKVLVTEVQSHPLTRDVIHIDLHQLDLKKPIRVVVPLNFVGKAKGVAEGGIVSISVRQVEIKCIPTEIPQHIDVDVTDVGVNQSLHISELAKAYEEKGQKIQFIYESDYSLVGVVPPEDEVAAAPVVAADAAATPTAGATTAGAAAPAAGDKDKK